jgi:hypothetical protein
MKIKVIYLFAFLLILTASCKNKDGSIITKVYVDDKNQSVVLFDTKQKNGIILLSDTNYAFWVIDTIQNNEWILVERAPSKFETIMAEGGRVTTQRSLFYVPEKKEIALTAIDPSLPYSMLKFEKRDTVTYLIANDDRTFPLKELLTGFTQFIPEHPEEETVTQPTGVDLVSLRFDTINNEFGLKGFSQQFNNATIYAIQCFGLFNEQIFIVDAMNFRVLVYDYTGKLVRKINYPRKLENGNWISITDICIDEGLIYLCSDNERAIYVLDSDKGDVIYKIDGKETENKKFHNIRRIALDNKKNLLVCDPWDNSLYYYSKDSMNFKLIKRIPYVDDNQLIFDSKGNNYSTSNDSTRVALINSQGETIGHFSYSLNVGGSNIIGIDENDNIYIQTFENKTPGAQFVDESYIKIISPAGLLTGENLKVNPWPGGPFTKAIVVDTKGSIFAANFDFKGFKGEASPDMEPTGLIIKKIK